MIYFSGGLINSGHTCYNFSCTLCFIVNIFRSSKIQRYGCMTCYNEMLGTMQGTVVAHSPPTCEVGGSNSRRYVGKLVVTY